ncbi:hypothetical protein ACDZ29_23275 [Peribacillus sp. RS7]|uniref:hypothetical protein n=1 Tax=Peribacillus sp. RS7 TaxID=3242679 RepID=UPI0035C17EE2
MKTFLGLTVGIICSLIAIIGLSSDIAGLTGYNIVYTIKKNAPNSYIILVLIIVIMYLLAYIREIRNQIVKKPDESNLDNSPPDNVLSASDISVLDNLFDTFSGCTMYDFFDTLADTRSVNINQAVHFDEAIKLFLSPHKRLRSQTLEKAKGEFLNAFGEFLLYSTSFESNNGVIARFKSKSDEEEDRYLEIVRRTYKQWSDFLVTVAKEVPNYQIKD